MNNSIANKYSRHFQPLEIVAEKNAVDPWKGAELPSGYIIGKKGVYKEMGGDKPNEQICGPLWVVARTQSSDSKNFGVLVNWADRGGGLHERAIRQSRLHEQNTTLAQELADEGLFIPPGKEHALKSYLALANPKKCFQSVDRLGWSKDASGRVSFILAGRTITSGGGERVLFQPLAHAASAATMREMGDLESYKTDVVARIANQPLLLFCFFASLSGALLKHSATETGGFHIHGASTGGKTTALQVAASVWGNGADPQRDPDAAFCQRWNATANGIEGLAAAHNDSALCLDELGTFVGDDFSAVIYNALGGKGKTRMTAEGSQRPTSTWRLLMISTGEISIADRVKQDGKPLKDGLAVRLVDIPVGGSLIIGLDSAAAADLSDTLKNAVGMRVYGVAGPAFIERLISRYPDEDSLSRHVREKVELAKAQLKEMANRDLPQTAARVLQRFALVLATGLLSRDLLNLPLSAAQIESAVVHVLNLWLGNGTSLATETDRAFREFQEFIEENRHRFADGNPVGVKAELRRGDLGYTLNDCGQSFFCFTSDGWKEATKADRSKIQMELERRRLMQRTEGDRWNSKLIIGGNEARLYRVSAKVLDE